MPHACLLARRRSQALRLGAVCSSQSLLLECECKPTSRALRSWLVRRQAALHEASAGDVMATSAGQKLCCLLSGCHRSWRPHSVVRSRAERRTNWRTTTSASGCRRIRAWSNDAGANHAAAGELPCDEADQDHALMNV